MADELLKESDALNEMAIKVVNTREQDNAGTVTKRRLADYDDLEEKAAKVLEMCKKLKAAERQRQV